MHEQINMKGSVTLLLTDMQGRVIEQGHYKNRIVRAGRQLVAQMFGGVSAGTPPGRVTHMAVGTGASPESDDQTALDNERARKAITEVRYSDIEEGSGASVVKRVRASLRVVFDFTEANAPEPLREAGIFTAASGGVMYNRVVFDPVSKTNAFQLTLLWEITF